MQSLVIHGRQPALGRGELESLYGAEKLRPVGAKATLVDVDPCLLAFDRLGGGVKFCKVLTVLNTNNWQEIEKFLVEVSPGHSERMPPGKMQLGLSVIGLNVSAKQMLASSLKLKNAIKKTGRNVRVIPNKASELNAAQVLHNNLTGPTGWELVFIRDDEQTIIAQTVKVQDIEGYAKRDRLRPMRDSKVGMLPPKLAQIIINLAVGILPEEARQSVCEIPPEEPIPPIHLEQTILDPFCGTGVILQESELMGYGSYGSDIEPRMVEYSAKNLAWLKENTSKLQKTQYKTEQADATKHIWKPTPNMIASEVFLGRPLNSLPDQPTLKKIISDCDIITTKFLKNVASQTKSGFRLCIAVPAWKAKNEFFHLPTLDKLSALGYNRLSFVHVSDDELIYHREDQTVARELIILERI